jgi:hypothetical protein
MNPSETTNAQSKPTTTATTATTADTHGQNNQHVGQAPVELEQFEVPQEFESQMQQAMMEGMQSRMNVIVPGLAKSMLSTAMRVQNQAMMLTAQRSLMSNGFTPCAFVNSRTGERCIHMPVKGSKYCRVLNHKATMAKRDELEELRQLVDRNQLKRKRNQASPDDEVEIVEPAPKQHRGPLVSSVPSSVPKPSSSQLSAPKTPQQQQVAQIPRVNYTPTVAFDADVDALLASFAPPSAPAAPARESPTSAALTKNLSGMDLNADMTDDNVYDSEDHESEKSKGS